MSDRLVTVALLPGHPLPRAVAVLRPPRRPVSPVPDPPPLGRAAAGGAPDGPELCAPGAGGWLLRVATGALRQHPTHLPQLQDVQHQHTIPGTVKHDPHSPGCSLSK